MKHLQTESESVSEKEGGKWCQGEHSRRTLSLGENISLIKYSCLSLSKWKAFSAVDICVNWAPFCPLPKTSVCVQAANDYASRLATIRRLYCPQEWTVAYKFVFMQLTDMNVFAEKIYFYTWALVIRLLLSFICKMLKYKNKEWLLHDKSIHIYTRWCSVVRREKRFQDKLGQSKYGIFKLVQLQKLYNMAGTSWLGCWEIESITHSLSSVW